jgi:tetratricopeptide (TPR) repeat protein
MSTKGPLRIGIDRYLPEGKQHLRRGRSWYLYLAGFVLSLLGLVAACAPVSPGEQQYLAAAAGYRANLRYDLALARYSDASRAAPTDPLPYCLSGQIRVLQQEWATAAATFAECARLGPGRSQAWLELGDTRSRLGDSAGATLAWKRSAGLGDIAAAERLAEAAEARGDVTGALELWRQIPADRLAIAHLGILDLWQGNARAAAGEMRSALAGGNPSAAWLVTDGFTVLVALPEHSADTGGRLGHAFLDANLPALALAPFQDAVKLAPNDGEAHSYLGWTLLLLGRTAQAAKEIDQGLRLSPLVSFTWFAAGELALARQQPGPAIRYLQEGATIDPRNPLFWAEAGRASLLQHDYASAEQMLETASNLSTIPVEAIALLHIYVDFHLGLLDGSARRAGIDATRRWPGNEALEFLLAEIFTDNNESANAFYAAEEAHLLDPTDPGPYVLLATQAENEGDYVHAALLLRVALALSPNGPFASQAETLLAPIQDISA